MELLQPTLSSGQLSISGQTAVDTEKSSLIQRGIYQRVREADGRNWFYYQLFLRQDFEACSIALANCEEPDSPVQETYGIFIKALIAKRQGRLVEALTFMKQCHIKDQKNLEVLKELISLTYLTCSYQETLIYLQLAKQVQPSEDWFIAHHQALCQERLGDLSLAEEYFKSAINIQPQEKSYLALAEFHIRHDALESALDALERAKRVIPESPLIASRLGQLQTRNHKDAEKGFGNLAQAASATKNNDENIVFTVGSVMQQKMDHDGALKKYESILQDSNNVNPAILNNIGLCYFAKRKTPAPKRGIKVAATDDEYSQRVLQAISCLTKAHQMAPLDWKIAGNLGYVARELKLYATASYYLMASIRLARKSSALTSYMLLAGVADNLDIPSQANQLFKYAVKSNSTRDPCVYLNYATFLLRQGEHDRATEMARECKRAAAEWGLAGRSVESSITDALKIFKLSEEPVSNAVKPTAPVLPPGSPSSPTGHEMVVAAEVEKRDAE